METFARSWSAEILPGAPAILPSRHYSYPQQMEEGERGALFARVRPAEGQAFVASFALGFADPLLPTGIWSAPHPDQLCAIAGGYAYVVDTRWPERGCVFLPLRPVYQVWPVAGPRALLLFAGSRTVVAWGAEGCAWESEPVSDEGVRLSEVQGELVRGMGWERVTDCEQPFVLDVRSGLKL